MGNGEFPVAGFLKPFFARLKNEDQDLNQKMDLHVSSQGKTFLNE